VTNIIVPGKKKIKVLIGIPSYESIKNKAFGSFTDFLVDMCHSRRFSCHSKIQEGTYLDQNREELAQLAIDNNHDYLLFIDSDTICRSDILDKLYDRNKDIIGGIYSLRCGKQHGPAIYNYVKEKDTFAQYKYWPINDGVIKVDGIGTGLLLIKVSALKKIPAPRFAYLECRTPDKNGNRRRLGEDLSFCKRCAEQGIKIYADTHIWVGHLGEKVWTRTDFELRQIVEKENYKHLEFLSIG